MIIFTTRWTPTWKVICLVKELETEPTAKKSITEKWNACAFEACWGHESAKSKGKKMVSCRWLLLKLHTHKTKVSSLMNCLTWFVLLEPQPWQIYQNMSYVESCLNLTYDPERSMHSLTAFQPSEAWLWNMALIKQEAIILSFSTYQI